MSTSLCLRLTGASVHIERRRGAPVISPGERSIKFWFIVLMAMHLMISASSFWACATRIFVTD